MGMMIEVLPLGLESKDSYLPQFLNLGIHFFLKLSITSLDKMIVVDILKNVPNVCKTYQKPTDIKTKLGKIKFSNFTHYLKSQ